ncbi:hypothetical protein PFISCL1PPCAC_20997, partial [Pristionchus fissidentatus]
SSVFSSLFYNENEEKNRKEFAIHDVEYEKFVDLLNMIYPTSTPFAPSNIDHILALAVKFNVKDIIRNAETYLIQS